MVQQQQKRAAYEISKYGWCFYRLSVGHWRATQMEGESKHYRTRKEFNLIRWARESTIWFVFDAFFCWIRFFLLWRMAWGVNASLYGKARLKTKNVFQSIELKYKILVIELPFFTVGIFSRLHIEILPNTHPTTHTCTLRFTRSPCNQIYTSRMIRIRSYANIYPWAKYTQLALQITPNTFIYVSPKVVCLHASNDVCTWFDFIVPMKIKHSATSPAAPQLPFWSWKIGIQSYHSQHWYMPNEAYQ